MVTHEHNVAARADRSIYVLDGKIKEENINSTS
jgi:predicted ABC-type transport system involved in lysophospholipase L1 biosynthesis ATPase subunit